MIRSNFLNGPRGQTRTGTVSLPVDFESTASTNFTTRGNLFIAVACLL